MSIRVRNYGKVNKQPNFYGVFLLLLFTMAHTQESLHTFSAVSTMSMMVKIGRMMPMMPTGAPMPAMRERVRK